MRDYEKVIAAMLALIPQGELSLRKALERQVFNSRFVAPEVFRSVWAETMNVLHDHLKDRQDESWVKAVLVVWRGESS